MPSSHSVRVSNALSEVLRTGNDGLGALEATTSHAWSVVMGAQGSHQLSGASSPVQLLDPGPGWGA